ncbi:hypothetical protein [Catellatospora methionotrophica]|uniref:hypothetical protein n=1 Tax=Catellatospora methionotrophica TaxID=121620 RepID=UPI003404EA37
MSLFSRLRRDEPPAWASESTQEILTITHVNRETAWAAANTGLLKTISAKLRELDRADGEG